MAVKSSGSKLRINDIELKIPPQSISIIKNDYNAAVSTLRTPIGTRVKSGRKNITIVVNTLFANGYDPRRGETQTSESWINSQLAPLLVQVRKCPFVSVENEKIRKEVLGNELGSRISASKEEIDSVNMAAIIKSITVTTNANEPGIFHTQIVMQYFNYTPFSSDFTFRDLQANGRSLATDDPSQSALFKEFYQSGTMNGSNFVNAIDVKKGNNLEFYFKEYTGVTDFNQDGLEKLEALGWRKEQDFEAAKERNITYSRYRKFTIEETVNIKSGALVLESGTISLNTNTPSIPLAGHVIPTAQSLGSADGTITLTLFANANLDPQTSRPTGTSSELAKLNRIIEYINSASLRFHKVAKNDTLLIRHPLSSLLKYKAYDENDTYAYNEVTGKLEAFNPVECLGCILENTNSQTVEGMPYCSRMTMQLTENWRSFTPNIREENVGGSQRTYEATQGMLIALADRYGIVKDSLTGFRITKTPPDPITSSLGLDSFPQPGANNADYDIALKLVNYLNDSRRVKELNSPKDYITDKTFLMTKSSEFTDKDLNIESTEAEMARAGVGVEFGFSGANYSSSNKPKPLSYDRMNEMVTELIQKTYNPNTNKSIYSEYDPYMIEFTSINRVKDESTYPDMLLPRYKNRYGSNKYTQPDYFFYNQSDTDFHKNFKYRIENKAIQRLKDVTEQFNEQVGNADANKNYNNEVKGSYGVPTAAPNIVAYDSENLWGKKNKMKTDKPYSQLPLHEGEQTNILKQGIRHFEEITYSMRRSMPTFKLYIKEDDYGSLSDLERNAISKKRGIWRNFANFYDMNSIVDIRLVKDRENPADLLVIRMTNTKEDIINKAYNDYQSGHEERTPSHQKRSPGDTKTVDQLDLNGVMLKEGAKIELRLGYDVDPNNLKVEFSGRIARMGGGDIIEIVCQGDGIELIQDLKGVGTADEFTFNSNTLNIITKVLEKATEVKSFGSRGARTALGELDTIWDIAGGRSIVENIFAPSLFGFWENFEGKTIRYTGYGATIGSVLPGLGHLIGAKIGGAIGLVSDITDVAYTFFKGSKFVIYEQTIWDILQELTMRHPGTICGIAPFDRRSTLFFGYPDQMYFYRGPTFAEALNLDIDRSYSSLGLVELNRREQLAEILKHRFGATTTNLTKEKLTSIAQKSPGETLSKLLDFLKPYRTYHLVTSEHDIVENSMFINSDEVYNSMQVVYPDSTDSDNLNFDGTVGFSEYKKTDEIKADDDLTLEYIKRQTLVFHNAHDDIVDDLPERYAITNLCRSLNNVYKGKIKILGRPGIKPYDIVYIQDSYNNISGPVEVREVVQTISYQTGWITEITPGMIVQPTTSNTYHQIKAMERVVKSSYLKNVKLFYSGAIIDPDGELVNTVKTQSSISTRFGKGLVDETLTGGAIAGSLIIGGNIALKLPENLRNAKSTLKAVSTTTGIAAKAAGYGKALSAGIKFVAGRTVATSIPILSDMFIDYAVGAYTSWSKFRQPIIFVPVQRNAKPWYTGLHGLQNNTKWEAVKGEFKDVLEKGEFFLSYVRDHFSEAY